MFNILSVPCVPQSEAAYSAALEALATARPSHTDLAVLHSNRAGARLMVSGGSTGVGLAHAFGRVACLAGDLNLMVWKK